MNILWENSSIKIKRFQSYIIQNSLGAIKSKDLNRVAKTYALGREPAFINNYII
jgi:hypothetical protein